MGYRLPLQAWVASIYLPITTDLNLSELETQLYHLIMLPWVADYLSSLSIVLLFTFNVEIITPTL